MAGILSTETRTKQRGGYRKHAGRKRHLRFDPKHCMRPELSAKHGVHAMLRTLPSVPRLRQRAAFEAIRAALVHFLEADDFRVVHISIQRNHIHLIVEAANKQALRRGTKLLRFDWQWFGLVDPFEVPGPLPD